MSKSSQVGNPLPDYEGLAGAKFVKYTKIPPITRLTDIPRLNGREAEVYEKLDGGNCQVRRIGWQLVAGSKAHFLKGKKVIERVEWFKDLNAWMYSNDTLYKLPQNIVVFGEWLSHHTVQYAKENENQFYLIDVLDTDDNRFLSYEDAVRLLQILEIKGVRFLERLACGKGLTSRKLESLVFEEPSPYRDDKGPKEGVVIKDYKNQEFWKFKHPDFEEYMLKPDGSVEFTTAARIRKGLYSYLEERGPPIIPEELAKHIQIDILEETGKETGYEEVLQKVRNFLIQNDVMKHQARKRRDNGR
jgi:hypothetical protein